MAVVAIQIRKPKARKVGDEGRKGKTNVLLFRDQKDFETEEDQRKREVKKNN